MISRIKLPAHRCRTLPPTPGDRLKHGRVLHGWPWAMAWACAQICQPGEGVRHGSPAPCRPPLFSASWLVRPVPDAFTGAATYLPLYFIASATTLAAACPIPARVADVTQRAFAPTLLSTALICAAVGGLPDTTARLGAVIAASPAATNDRKILPRWRSASSLARRPTSPRPRSTSAALRPLRRPMRQPSMQTRPPATMIRGLSLLATDVVLITAGPRCSSRFGNVNTVGRCRDQHHSARWQATQILLPSVCREVGAIVVLVILGPTRLARLRWCRRGSAPSWYGHPRCCADRREMPPSPVAGRR